MKAQYDGRVGSASPHLATHLPAYQEFIENIASTRALLQGGLIATVYVLIGSSSALIIAPAATGITARDPTIVISLFAFSWIFGFAVLALVLALEESHFPLRHGSARKKDRISEGFDSLVDALSSRKASVYQDKAFGIQSVLETLLRRELPVPDYSIPKPQLYRRLTWDVLEATGSLQILHVAALHRVHPGPSWVPDWSCDFDAFWLIPNAFFPYATYRARRVQPWFRKVLNDQDALKVRVFPVCKLAGCVQLQPTESTYDLSDDHAHLHNLGVMLGAVGMSQGGREVEHIHQLSSLITNSMSQTEKHSRNSADAPGRLRRRPRKILFLWEE